MNNSSCFVAVEFVEDVNVKGYTYWYICNFSNAEEGDKVIAPLGRHNNVQEGVIRRVLFADDEHAPFPIHYIKSIRKLIKKEDGSV
ncbi:MAG: hypothetical protein K2I30_03705 [Clostridia bacterium]|nr:hypothetical protein [Clostridia bacterium]